MIAYIYFSPPNFQTFNELMVNNDFGYQWGNVLTGTE